MKKIFFLTLSILIMGCNNSPQLKRNYIPPKKTSVIDENIDNSSSTKKETNNRKIEYHNNFGDDFGYFDRDGYFCNSRYYHYDNRYRYEDRLYRRGYFSTNVKHARVYEEEDNGNGYYYPVSSTRPKNRVFHPEHLEERSIGSGGYSNLKY